jgi:hypothetical protein
MCTVVIWWRSAWLCGWSAPDDVSRAVDRVGVAGRFSAADSNN